MSYQPIENYGIIGDLNTVALAGLNGSIDFMCFPDFDSPSVFAALLDDKNGGRFRIAPLFHEMRHKQMYLPDTNVLLTRFLSNDGVAEIIDFMPVEDAHEQQVIRRVTTIRGQVTYRLKCSPRFNYGTSPHNVELLSPNEAIFHSTGKDKTTMILRSV